MESAKEYRKFSLPSGWEYAYAYVFFIAIFLGQTVRFFVGSEPLIGAQPAQILIPLVTFAVSVVLWVLSPLPVRSPSGLVGLFFGLLILIWLWALIRDWGAVDLTAFTLGPFLAMLATKTPTPACALRILNTIGVLVLFLFAAASVFAVTTDVPPTGFITKWPPLTDPFEPIGMWWAPLNGPAESGALGAMLILLGTARKGALSLVFIGGGVLLLFYSGTLSAALGVGVGLVVLLVSWFRRTNSKLLVGAGLAVVGLTGIVVLARELAVNASLSGRTYIWSDFLEIIKANPIFGSGTASLTALEQTRTLPDGSDRLYHGSDAHNMLLDAWARFGIIGCVLVFAAITAAVVLTYQGFRIGRPIGLSLTTALLAIGLVEHNIWWGTPGTAISVFLLSVLTSPSAENTLAADPTPTPDPPSLGKTPAREQPSAFLTHTGDE